MKQSQALISIGLVFASIAIAGAIISPDEPIFEAIFMTLGAAAIYFANRAAQDEKNEQT